MTLTHLMGLLTSNKPASILLCVACRVSLKYSISAGAWTVFFSWAGAFMCEQIVCTISRVSWPGLLPSPLQREIPSDSMGRSFFWALRQLVWCRRCYKTWTWWWGPPAHRLTVALYRVASRLSTLLFCQINSVWKRSSVIDRHKTPPPPDSHCMLSEELRAHTGSL